MNNFEFYVNEFYEGFQIGKTTEGNCYAKAGMRKHGLESGTAN